VLVKERRSKKPAPVIVTGPLSEHVNEENQRANGYPRLTWKVVDQVIFHRLSWIFELVVVGTVYQGVEGEAKLGQLISHYKSKRCFTRHLAVTCSRCTWMDLQDIALFQIFWKIQFLSFWSNLFEVVFYRFYSISYFVIRLIWRSEHWQFIAKKMQKRSRLWLLGLYKSLVIALLRIHCWVSRDFEKNGQHFGDVTNKSTVARTVATTRVLSHPV